MDKTNHSDWLIVVTYSLMAFCWAGKNMLSFKDMLICGFSGIVLGAVVVIAEKTRLPVYIRRSLGAFAAALVLIEVYLFTGWMDSDAMTVIGSMIPPVAAGAMLIDGMSQSGSTEGRKKILNAILVSVCLAAAVYFAVAITERRGLSL